MFTVRISKIGKGQELCILGARRVLGNEMFGIALVTFKLAI